MDEKKRDDKVIELGQLGIQIQRLERSTQEWEEASVELAHGAATKRKLIASLIRRRAGVIKELEA